MRTGNYQLNFPFVKELPAEIDAWGHITAKGFLRAELGDSKYYGIAKKNPAKLEKELERINRILGKSEGRQGCVHLLPGTANYFAENFMPRHWAHRAEQIQERRAIYKLCALKTDGTTQDIMIKEPKAARWRLYDAPSRWLTPLDRIQIHKHSKTEAELLIAMEKAGILVEKPLGYFEEGIEEYLYTEFVHGKNPLELLSDKKMRQKVLEADARLLAKLCKAGIKFQYFFSSKFDDKLWADNRLVLIDTDEAEYVLKTGCGDYFKKHPDELPKYYTSWLQDCLSAYLSAKIIKESELLNYAKAFYSEKGDDIALAKAALKEVKPDRTSEESGLAMMMECD